MRTSPEVPDCNNEPLWDRSLRRMRRVDSTIGNPAGSPHDGQVCKHSSVVFRCEIVIKSVKGFGRTAK